MKQNSADSLLKAKNNNMNKISGKYSKIVEAFKYYDIIQENSHEKVTVKLNDGGIIYIEVEHKKTLK